MRTFECVCSVAVRWARCLGCEARPSGWALASLSADRADPSPEISDVPFFFPRRRASDLPLAEWPVRRPTDWLTRVNRELTPEALENLRVCVQRGRPLGASSWVRSTAERLGLGFTLRGPGRPKSGNQ